MIPIEVTFLAFLALAIITSSKTYFILAAFSFLNIYVYPHTSSEDINLLDIYATIDFFACLAVLLFGDIHRIYQSIILAIMVLCHGMMEQSLYFDFYYDATSTIYESVIAALLIAQMMGVFRGTDYLHNLRFYIWKVRRFGSSNRKGSL